MAKKELRTVKKSTQTGRLSRDAVRSAVISVRDGRSSSASKLQYGGRTSATSNKR
jgi:hypothetical protein